MAIDKILKTELIDGEIRISIGLEALAFAVEYSPDWDDDYKIDRRHNFKDFGKSFLKYLEYEEEDGTTPVHRLFDNVALEALEQGEYGFVENEDNE